MAKPIEHHIIVLDAANDSSKTYGVTHKSRNVFDTTKSHSPTRLDVWDNTGRPNPYKGLKLGDVAFEGNPHRQQVITDWFLRTYPNAVTAEWFDPQNNPTDEPVSLLLSLESTAICADTRFNTGAALSGQVYAKGTRLGDRDTATLVYPDGTTREIMLHFPPHNNGHGYAQFTDTTAHLCGDKCDPPNEPETHRGIQIGDGNHQVNNF
jgi:hypothetical protein